MQKFALTAEISKKVAGGLLFCVHPVYYTTLWNLKNLKYSSRTCYQYHCIRDRRSLRIYPTLTIASKIRQISIELITQCGNIAREGVQNTYHWSERTETATRGCRCGSHSSVASSIGPDWWCMFCTLSVAIFRIRCNHLDSNLANFQATVDAG